MTLPDPAAPLSAEDAGAAFAAILDGDVTADAIAAFLITLSARGETATEITAAAMAMRARMLRITAPAAAIDVCGTGGDGAHSLNVSTAVAIVVAACDVPVAKHGNRAASSSAGAADTLEALGLNLDRASETAEKTLADLGICFLFAQKHHPAMGPVMAVRRAIGGRTIFNLLGPLCNPAGVRRQLVGVPDIRSVGLYEDVLQALDTERFMVVCGTDGGRNSAQRIDELSISGRTIIVEHPSRDAQSHRPMGWERNVSTFAVEPIHGGFTKYRKGSIRGGDAHFNANALRRLLTGEVGAYRDAVLFNSAAALIVAGEARDWQDGVEEAAEAIDKGLANALLNCWITY